jgi:hypothetical protein
MVPVLITMVIFIQWRIGQMKIESNRKKSAVKPTQLEVPPAHTAGAAYSCIHPWPRQMCPSLSRSGWSALAAQPRSPGQPRLPRGAPCVEAHAAAAADPA